DCQPERLAANAIEPVPPVHARKDRGRDAAPVSDYRGSVSAAPGPGRVESGRSVLEVTRFAGGEPSASDAAGARGSSCAAGPPLAGPAGGPPPPSHRTRRNHLPGRKGAQKKGRAEAEWRRKGGP